MLNIKTVIEGIYKKIFLILLLVQIITLGVTALVYFYNTRLVFSELKKSFENELISQYQTYDNYFYMKYNLLMGNLAMVAKYTQAFRYYYNENPPKEELLNSQLRNLTCNMFFSDIVASTFTKTNIFTMPSDYDKKRITLDRSKLPGAFFTGKDRATYETVLYQDKFELFCLCDVYQLIDKLIESSIYSSDMTPPDYNYFHFSYENTGLFVGKPHYYSVAYDFRRNGTYVDTSRGDYPCERDNTNYDPRCRPFYINAFKESIEGNIANIIIPYSFPNGRLGSEICIKIYDRRNNPKSKLSTMLSCLVYNFYDLELVTQQSINIIGNEKIRIIFRKPLNDEYKLSTIFASDISVEKFVSFSQFLDLKNPINNKFFSKDDFFEVMYYDLFYELYNEIKDQNNKKVKEQSIIIVKELIEFFNKYIYVRFKELSEYTKSKKYLTQNELTYMVNHTLGFIQLNETYYFDKAAKEIKKSQNTTYVYVLPILLNASVNEDYSIGNKNLAELYLVFIRSEIDEYRTNKFIEFIGFEFGLVLIHLIGMNFLIWPTFNTVEYYCFTAFFMPFKIINRVFDNIYFNNVKEFQKDFELLCGEEDKKEGEVKDITSKIKLEKRIMTILNLIIDLDEYKEIRDIKKTLKILTLIRSNKSTRISDIPLNFKLNDKDSNLVNIIDALLYLIKDFNTKIADGSLDSKFLVDMVFLNYIFLLKKGENFEEFYKHIRDLFERIIEDSSGFKKIKPSRKSADADISYKKKHVVKETEDNLLYSCLNEEITYKFINFKNNKLDNLFQELVQPHEKIIENECFLSSDDEDKLLKNPTTFEFKNMKSGTEFKDLLLRKTNSELNNFNIQDNNSESTDSENSKKSKDQGKSTINLNKSIDSDNVEDNKLRSNFKTDFKTYINKKKECDLKAKEFITEINFYLKEYIHYSNPHIIYIKQAICYIFLANTFYISNKEEESLKKCLQTIETIKKFSKNAENKGHLTRIAYYTVASVMFERVLKILANLNLSLDQNKTENFIYLKMLDISLVYNKSLRNENLSKMMDLVKKHHYMLLKSHQSVIEINSLLSATDSRFYQLKLIRHKLRCLMNINKSFRKNVVLVYDVDFPFIRQNKNRFKHFLKEIFSSESYSKNSLYFSLFDSENLYCYMEKGISFGEGKIININEDSNENSVSEDENSPNDSLLKNNKKQVKKPATPSFKQNVSEKKFDIEKMHEQLKKFSNRFDEEIINDLDGDDKTDNFSFIFMSKLELNKLRLRTIANIARQNLNVIKMNSNFKKVETLNNVNLKNSSTKKPRITGIKKSNIPLGIELSLKLFDFPNEYPKNNNFMIVFTTASSRFDLAKQSLMKLSLLLLEKNYTIIIMVYTEDYMKDIQFITKIKYWCDNHILNGYVFPISLYSHIKNIVNIISPRPVRFYNYKKMKDYLNTFFNN